MKARNGIWNTKSGKKTGRYCNKFQFQFSIHINLSIHKETQTQTQQKKKTKKYQTDNATYNSLVSIYNTFYFPLCCHVDTCFFLKKIYIYFFRILFVLLWLFLVSVSLIVHIYINNNLNSELKTQIKYQKSAISNQKSTSNCLELNT